MELAKRKSALGRLELIQSRVLLIIFVQWIGEIQLGGILRIDTYSPNPKKKKFKNLVYRLSSVLKITKLKEVR